MPFILFANILLQLFCIECHHFNLVSYFSWDSLTVYDGGSTSSNLIGKFCGNSLPPGQILSSSYEILLHFKTNYGGTYDGFHIEYNTICKFHRFILFVTNKSSISFEFKLVQVDIWLETGSVMMIQTTQNAILTVGIAADLVLWKIYVHIVHVSSLMLVNTMFQIH